MTQETPTPERLEVRMPVSLRVMLDAAAKACHLSLSAYVRDRLTSVAQRDLRRAQEGRVLP